MPRDTSDRIVIIGGGIVGLAVARALSRRVREPLLVLEAERRVALHQTGHNSGVIHSGLYYRPGSLKAIHCVAGRRELYRFCAEHRVDHRRCGKLVVATTDVEARRLRELAERGRRNGLDGLRRVPASGLPDREPYVRGVEGLWVPQTGVVDFRQVALALADALRDDGVELQTRFPVRSIDRGPRGFTLRSGSRTVEARYLINCAGLQSDRVARMTGLDPGMRIVPFRGEYHRLAPDRRLLVRNLIYPVPDPRLPFLGVHFTRTIRGEVEVGPNAILALSRSGYRRLSFSARDTLSTLGYPGFWRLARRHWRSGASELRRSFRRAATAAALRRMLPELRDADLVRAGSGIRAQAVGRDGSLLDDFQILETGEMLHVLNAPSPAATASLSIGARVADMARRTFGLVSKG